MKRKFGQLRFWILTFLLLFLTCPAIAQEKENVFDRVMRTGTIRCAYVVWPPEFTIDPNTGEMSGIAYDLTMELARRLDLKVEWAEEVNFANMAEGLAADRYDMVCFSTYRQSARVKRADYTAAFYYSGTGVFVRTDDHRFDGKAYEVFNDPSVTISTIDGEMSQIIASGQFPKAKTFSIPQNSDFASLLLNVANKKADVTFANQIAAKRFRLSNPGLIRDIAGNKPLRVFSHGFVIKKGELVWGKTLDQVIAEMQDQGFIERTLQKYDEADNPVFFPVAKPYRPPG